MSAADPVAGLYGALAPRLSPYASVGNLERALALGPAAARMRRFRVPPGEALPGVSVVVLNLDHPELIVPLIESLLAQRRPFLERGLALEILVGDTGSTDRAVLACYERLAGEVRVLRDLSYNFSACNNRVATELAGRHALLFLNNDVELDAGTTPVWDLYRLLMREADTGAVGPLMLFPDGTVQHAGIEFFRERERRAFCYHPHAREAVDLRQVPEVTEVAALTGACLMVRREAFEAAGLMDEAYAAECQDVALCLALHRLGYRARLLNAGSVVHRENATRPRGEENWADRRRFLRKWGAYVEAHFL